MGKKVGVGGKLLVLSTLFRLFVWTILSSLRHISYSARFFAFSSGQFCQVYVTSYHNMKRMRQLRDSLFLGGREFCPGFPLGYHMYA